MADLSFTVSSRIKGAWRLRVASALFRLGAWVLSGYRVQTRIDGGAWHDEPVSVEVVVTT